MESGQGTLREVAHPKFFTLGDIANDPPEWGIGSAFSIGGRKGVGG